MKWAFGGDERDIIFGQVVEWSRNDLVHDDGETAG